MGRGEGWLVALVLAMGVVVAACGGDGAADDGLAVLEPSQTTTPPGTTSGPGTSGPGTSGPGTTTGSGTTAPTGDTGTTAGVELPGEPFDIGPGAGERLDVVNVRFDDVLNFRTLPDATAPIVDTVAPLAGRPVVVSQGEGRLLTRSAWWSVSVGGEPAWANVRFLGMLGEAVDVHGEVLGRLSSPRFETLDDLIDGVARARVVDGEAEPSVTVAAEPERLSATATRVVIDLGDLRDDAVKGERLALVAAPVGEGWELVEASARPICSRGRSGGLCT